MEKKEILWKKQKEENKLTHLSDLDNPKQLKAMYFAGIDAISDREKLLDFVNWYFSLDPFHQGYYSNQQSEMIDKYLEKH